MATGSGSNKIRVELRPLVGLLADVPPELIRYLAEDAIRIHRDLVDKAESLFQALPADVKTGKVAGSTEHLAYLKATIEMHAQMAALSSLIAISGHTPEV
ncbi:transcriptional repressor TraM [Rhizobium sp. AAP43]|uniref:transcriptional repressor TraM n=1 Tax=Rhizobium sp. AAP43 TaxID=1523420 RepID=UPI0006B99ED8|nr:transcriptional repressor TraM [Rhizobium sp. AAP43]KPF42608.1 hypothetical protein IP76_16445 [Rhizobium sp. AAP43]